MRYLLPVLTFLFVHFAQAQRTGPGEVEQRIDAFRKAGTAFKPVDVFRVVPPSAATNELWSHACRMATVVAYDQRAAAELIRSRTSFIALQVPTTNGTLTLDLQRVDVTTDDFTVHRASDGQLVRIPEGVHYRGAVRGVRGSLAAISFFGDQVMGIVSDGSGQCIIGRFDRAPEGLHVIYHERDLLGSSNAQCSTDDLPQQHHAPQGPADAERSTRCVHEYWEIGYDIFQNKGSVANATTYATGLFNQSAALFDNDGVNIQLSEIYVWDVASPYTQTSSTGRLNQFGTTRTSFNGDLAHLLDNGSYGGVAWLNTLCSSTNYRMGYSGIYNSFSNVPTYSWSVEVVTHETGHNLGSPHTHACSWNGNSTAIDGCGPAAGYTEGTCAQGPLPASNVGGTIMSYCHLTSSGINFANGFGPQPRALIVNSLNGATCLLACGTTCDAPGNLNVTGLNTTSGTLTWANVGVTGYTLRWKATASSTWTTVTGITATTYALSGLTQGTQYEFQVMSICTAGSSGFSPSRVFTTALPCPDSLEPNNSFAAAVTITPPTAINAQIASSTDQDFYRFTLASAGTVYIYLGNVAGDYDLYLLNSAGTEVASSELGGTSSESINYSAAAGTYVIQVVGYGGAFSSDQCYLLNVNVGATQGCGPVTGLNVTNIAWNSASLNWNTSVNTASYDLQWKVNSASTWTAVTGLTTGTYTLSDLSGSTTYAFQLRPNCPGGQSGYGEPVTFTTLATPCEVQPPIVLAVKALLEGPYSTINLLMNDSLRRQGLLPLSEPYTALGFAVTGASTTTAPVFATTGNNAIVDWVLVELRDPTTMTTVVERKAALLQRDGDIVGMDGTSALGFCSSAGSYRVVVRHRNHLGVMTGMGLSLGTTSTALDFTNPNTATYGTGALKGVGSVMVMWAGNTVNDSGVKYTGTGNDRDPILTGIGGTTPTNSVGGYLGTDVNMDGRVKYTGSGNDRDPILLNVGSTTPTTVRVQQLP